MNILAIDTSFDLCSCAIAVDDNVYEEHVMAKQNHGAVILPMLASMLGTAGLTLRDIHAIAFANGPGSFTAIRMTTAIVQGLALPHDIPIIAISTLTALAWHTMQALAITHCITAIDAHIGEIYVGCYEETTGYIQEASPQQLIRPDEFMPPYAADWYGVGSGFKLYHDTLKQKFSYNIAPTTLHEPPLATTLLALAMQQYHDKNYQHALQIEPLYLHTPAYRKNS